jgi:hypothetical protein
MGRWQDQAECFRRDLDRDLFFPDHEDVLDFRVISACRECHVIEECLQYAMRMEDSYIGSRTRTGIWGGMTPAQRTRFARGTGFTQIFFTESTVYRKSLARERTQKCITSATS